MLLFRWMAVDEHVIFRAKQLIESGRPSRCPRPPDFVLIKVYTLQMGDVNEQSPGGTNQSIPITTRR
jgi:hypothetical protein